MTNNTESHDDLSREILNLFQHNAGKILNISQLASLLEINDKNQLNLLAEAVAKEVIIGNLSEPEKGKYSIKKIATMVIGKIDFTSSGTAYLVCKSNTKDIFIQKGDTLDAFNGDMVEVELNAFGNSPEGRVIKIVERNKTDFVGTAQVHGNTCFIVPDNHKIHVHFYIPKGKEKSIQNGQKALIRFLSWGNGQQNPVAEVAEVLGFPGNHETEMNAIIAEFGLPEKFPEAVEKAAKNLLTDIGKDEIARRRDFRNITTFTIDPFDAKDFDDAISFNILDNKNFEVGVHIADVGHYLRPQDIIDVEALERATSVYLVDRVIPMLPETLSNFVCSLRPKEEKLCFSAVFELDKNANIIHEWYGKTVIFSDRRFTYEEVQKIIETKSGEYCSEILVLDGLAKKLREQRSQNGSLFFDKEEVKFRLDDAGKPVEVFFKIQQDAHKLIEDFMLLANRMVATFLSNKNTSNGKLQSATSVYRIHDTPSNEKLTDLANFVEKFGYSLQTHGKKNITNALNKLLRDVKGKPEAGTIEILAIRSMPKAIYTTDNIGHFGLGFDYYTHFTSPIRRYPDLLVHRLLEARLQGKTYSNTSELENFCKHSSEMEKAASEAERASIRYKQVEFLKEKVGVIFKAIVSGVTEWGIYVEILENKCEGLLRMRDVKDDSYYFDEKNFCYVGKRTGKAYRLGDAVEVELQTADMLKKQLTFIFPGNFQKNESGGGKRGSAGRKKGGSKNKGEKRRSGKKRF